MAILYNTSQKN